VLHDVELVVDDLALRRPLQDARPERLPHVQPAQCRRAIIERYSCDR